MCTFSNTHVHTSAHTVQARSLLAPFDDSCNHMWWKISFSLSEIFPPDRHSSPLTSPPFFPPPCCLPLLLSFFSLISYSMHLSIPLHSPPPSRPHPAPISSLWSAHPSLLLLLLPQGYLPSYTASPHPSLSFHLFISMSKSHPFIFLQMNRFCWWKRRGKVRSRMQRNTVFLTS